MKCAQWVLVIIRCSDCITTIYRDIWLRFQKGGKNPQQNYRKAKVEKEKNISYEADVTDQNLFCSSRRIPVQLFSLTENTSEATQAGIGS